MRQFTDEQLMQRAWDVYEIKNLMGRHVYYHAYNQHDREMEELWPRLPENRSTASFGQNWGYQVGYDLIWHNYVDVNEKNNIKELQARQRKEPDLPITQENYMLGGMVMHCLTAPLVEVAADGKTAQGMWYAPGHIILREGEENAAVWMYERYGADFIREPDGWKLWHLFIGTDFTLPAGKSMAEEPVDQPPFNLNDEDAETNMLLSHPFEAYTSRYNFPVYPPIPQPYESFADVVSNGPEGNPRYQEVLK